MAQSISLTHKTQTADVVPVLKPLPLWQALFYFGIPAVAFRLSIYNGIPVLLRLGLTPFEAFVVAFTVPLAVLFAVSLEMFKREGHPLTWAALAERLRLRPMTGKDWLWTIGGFTVGFVGTGLLGVTARMIIAAFPVLAPPAFFPVVANPTISLTPAVLADFVGAPILGNWAVVVSLFVNLCFNIFGEEFWWRGVILPRQELAHGRWTWIIHGILWTLFHVPFYPWQIFALMPVCLSIAFVCQQRQNTTPGILIHYATNGLIVVLVALMVAGLI